MADTNTLTATRKRGKPLINPILPRNCKRCGVNIDNRHKKAIYCMNCTDQKTKPYTVSCRLDDKTYKGLEKRLNGKTVQDVLESLIIDFVNNGREVSQ